jgi:hypothetical protein
VTRHTILGPRTTVPRLIFRLLAGRPLDGRPRTDSSFFLPGTRSVVAHVQRPSHWSMLPGWKRAGYRLGVPAVLAQFVVVRSAPWGRWVLLALALVAAAAAGWGGWRGYMRAREWRWRRKWVRPLSRALGPVLGVPHAAGLDWLRIPRDLHTREDAEARILLPPDFSGEDGVRKHVQQVVAAKLALHDAPEFRWKLAGREPELLVRQAPQPPARVELAQLVPHMTAAPESAPVLGLGVRSAPVAVDFDDESPHLLAGIGSGGGKSVTLRLLAAQVLARGGLVVVADLKRVSHRWMTSPAPLPGVAYVRDVADIHDALLAVAEEGDRRFRLIEEYGDDAVLGLPRVLFLYEEATMTGGRLTTYWQKIRQRSDPKASPAITEGLAGILLLGRQALIHAVAVGQSMTARVLGGPEMREAFSARLIGRATAQQQRMLAPDVKLPPSSKRPGRAQLVQGGDVHAVQIGLMSPEEARAWVVAGQAAAGVSWPVGASVRDLLAAGASSGLSVPAARVTAPLPVAGGRPALRLVSAPSSGATSGEEEPVGLAEAVEDGGPLAGLSLESVRKARYRDRDWPPVVARRGTELLYRPSDLARWRRNRVRAEAPAGAESSS